MLAFEAALESYNVALIAFGHHKTDATSSLLKAALMYIDRWDDENERFSRPNFEDLVERLGAELRSPGLEHRPVLSRVAELVDSGAADTDEPPRQPLKANSDVEVVRPLFLLDERVIAEWRDHGNVETQPSGCGHGATADTQTPRELVQSMLLSLPVNGERSRRLDELLVAGIAGTGEAKYRTRQRRAELLGSMYRATDEDLDKL